MSIKELHLEEKEMSLYEKLINGEEKLALVGLGYVGMLDLILTKQKLTFIKQGVIQQKKLAMK